MLVLSRKSNESIVCSLKLPDGTVKEITLTVLSIESRKVRLGFETTPDVSIVRTELLEKSA